MSRIGNKIIIIPEGVTVSVEKGLVSVKGPKGSLTLQIPTGIVAIIEEATIKVSRPNDSKMMKMLHGTTRANINNMVVGVSQGFETILEIIGIGYRSALRGKDIVLNVGHSHEDVIEPFEGVTIEVPTPNEVHVKGYDKQKVGQIAALIRGKREPEPYKGKGIKYRGEHILRKEGKRAGKK